MKTCMLCIVGAALLVQVSHAGDSTSTIAEIGFKLCNVFEENLASKCTNVVKTIVCNGAENPENCKATFRRAARARGVPYKANYRHPSQPAISPESWGNGRAALDAEESILDKVNNVQGLRGNSLYNRAVPEVGHTNLRSLRTLGLLNGLLGGKGGGGVLSALLGGGGDKVRTNGILDIVKTLAGDEGGKGILDIVKMIAGDEGGKGILGIVKMLVGDEGGKGILDALNGILGGNEGGKARGSGILQLLQALQGNKKPSREK